MSGAASRGVGYGRGEQWVEEGLLPPNPEHVLALVRQTFADPKYQPPMLPASALEVRRLSSLGTVTIEDVVTVIGGDPLLAANAMRVAHSPSFATRAPPTTLRAAVEQMGLRNISGLAFGVAARSHVFRDDVLANALQDVRRHAVATARVAALLAAGTPVADYAYTCGLLHDIGTAAILLVLAQAKVGIAPEFLAATLASLHEEAGALVVQGWGLSRDIGRGVVGHHRPTTREGALVRVAEDIALTCGFDVAVAPHEQDARHSDAARQQLNLNDERYAETLKTARAMLLAGN